MVTLNGPSRVFTRSSATRRSKLARCATDLNRRLWPTISNNELSCNVSLVYGSSFSPFRRFNGSIPRLYTDSASNTIDSISACIWSPALPGAKVRSFFHFPTRDHLLVHQLDSRSGKPCPCFSRASLFIIESGHVQSENYRPLEKLRGGDAFATSDSDLADTTVYSTSCNYVNLRLSSLDETINRLGWPAGF